MRKPDTIAFSSADTKAIKGFALILMLFHHLVALPDRVPVGFEGFTSLIPQLASSGYLQKFALAGTICLPMFFFLGGYGLYIRWKKPGFSLTGSLLNLLQRYWKVFFVFVPIALLFFRRSGEGINPLAAMYSLAHPSELLSQLIANFATLSYSLNPEWWFLNTYLCTMVVGYLYCRATRKVQNFWSELFLVLVLSLLTSHIFPGIGSIPAFASLQDDLFFSRFLCLTYRAMPFFVGIVFAKYDGLRKLKAMLLRLPCPALVSLAGIGAIYWSWMYTLPYSAALFFCPVLIAMLSTLLDSLTPVKKLFGFLGRHSTNIWLIHSFYCYYFLEVTHLVYISRLWWVDLLILVGLSLVSSMALDKLYALAAGLAAKRDPSRV